MSTLKADTIQSTGGGAATLTNQQAAKVWCNWDSSQTARDSFNISTVTDTALGRATLAFTNNMSNNDYAIASHQRQGTGDSYLKGSYGLAEGTDTISTSELLIRHASVNASTFTAAYDADYNSTILHGDLA
jgi:hypothetical protein